MPFFWLQVRALKSAEIVPLPSKVHLSIPVSICERFLKLKEKVNRHEKPPDLGWPGLRNRTKGKRLRGSLGESYQSEGEGVLAM
jgi:hypothetical protein